MEMAFKAPRPDPFSTRALPARPAKHKTQTHQGSGFPFGLKAFVKPIKAEKLVQDVESQLRALLKDGIEAGNADKVYSTLQRLRILDRGVSASTGELIENWFAASRKWTVQIARVNEFGVCGCCGEKLATVDFDQTATEKLAKAVAAVAEERDRSFQQFQKWLEYYGPFEAVVDAANIGLFSLKKFSLTKVNRVVNAVRQELPSKTWPLVIVHNKRIGEKEMNNPRTAELMEKLKNANAIYATPSGSDDDWYWLYAAIKCRGLIVTNDEMRDHTFQLLGNDVFPKWKECHQVHFSFDNGNPVIIMPPSFSTAIQESERGHWHVPVVGQTAWLCIARDGEIKEVERENRQRGSQTESHRKLQGVLKDGSLLLEIEKVEKFHGCIIDFQI